MDIIREIQHEVMKQQLNGKNNMPPKKADALAVCTESDGKPLSLVPTKESYLNSMRDFSEHFAQASGLIQDWSKIN